MKTDNVIQVDAPSDTLPVDRPQNGSLTRDCAAMASTLIDLVRDLPVDDANEVHAALAKVTPEQLCNALMADTVTVTAPAAGGGAMGIPTLDGLGVMGNGYHTLDEYIEIASLSRRGRLLANLLATLS